MMKNTFLNIISSEVQFIPGPRPIPVTALLQGEIVVFSESGSGWAQGTSGRQWLVLSKRRNEADDQFPVRPLGAKQMSQYSVTALNKDMPLAAVCALSWIICLTLNTQYRLVRVLA